MEQEYAHPRQGDSFLIEQQKQLEQDWSDQDLQQHNATIRALDDAVVNLRAEIDSVRARTDTVWDHFVSLGLASILKQDGKAFLTEVLTKSADLASAIVEVTSNRDKLMRQVADYRQCLDRKIAQLEAKAHRISTQNHLSMMLSRISGLEAYLLGRKCDYSVAAKEAGPRKRSSNVPSDLLYLRVRLWTTHLAVLSSRKNKEVIDARESLDRLRCSIERLRTELAGIETRFACLTDLLEYWLAYLEIPDEHHAEPI